MLRDPLQIRQSLSTAANVYSQRSVSREVSTLLTRPSLFELQTATSITIGSPTSCEVMWMYSRHNSQTPAAMRNNPRDSPAPSATPTANPSSNADTHPSSRPHLRTTNLLLSLHRHPTRLLANLRRPQRTRTIRQIPNRLDQPSLLVAKLLVLGPLLQKFR